MSKKTLYLHIGTPKTGTTSIQMFCMNNREVLQKKGFEYPLYGFDFARAKEHRNGHFLVSTIMKSALEHDLEAEKREQIRGLKMVEASFEDYDKVLLSEEKIWNHTGLVDFSVWNTIKEFVDAHGYDLKVIVYLRRQDELTVSWKNQQIQDGWNYYGCFSWEHYMKRGRYYIALDYYDHLQKIAEVIGKDAIQVRIFERKNFPGGLIQGDFLDALGLTLTDEYDMGESSQNPTMPLNMAEIKRLINKLGPRNIGIENVRVRNFFKGVTNTCLRSSDYKSDWFSPEERREFLAKWQESNEKLGREYLGTEGSPFHTDIKDLPKWDPHNPHMYEDIIYFFGQALSRAEEQILNGRDREKDLRSKFIETRRTVREQTKQIDKLEKELAEQKKMIRELQQTAPLFRAVRKTRHLFGKDK